MAFYGARVINSHFDHTKMKWGFRLTEYGLFNDNAQFAMAVVAGSGGTASVNLPSLQIGGAFEEAVEIKIQIGGAWKDLA